MRNLQLNKNIILIFFLLFMLGCNNSFIDKLNPNVVAKVDNYKITLDEIKDRISDNNEKFTITKPITLFYINEIIKEKIIDDEFKRLKFKITEKDKQEVPFLDKLNKNEIIRYIKFRKVKDYVVRKITPPSGNECLKFYKEHIARYNHNEKVKLEYIIFNEKNKAEEVYKFALNKSLKTVLKHYKLKFNFKGIIAVENIPEDIRVKINYKKENSLWFVKSDSEYFYIIKVLKYYNKPIPFNNVKDKISAEILEYRQKKYFDLWLKNEIKKRKIIIYYNKI